MKTFIKRHYLTVIFTLLSVAFLFCVWAIAWAVKGNELIVPSLGGTLSAFFALFGEGEFWLELCFTLLRVAAAVAISFALAIICTALGLIYAPFKSFISPIVAVCRTVPTVAVTLILMLAFKGFTPIMVTLLVVFPMFCSQLGAAADGVDKGLIQMARSYGVKNRDIAFKIVLPQVAPAILSQLGTTLSFALKLTVSAELLAYTKQGLGELLRQANFNIEVARFAALTISCVLLGLVIEGVFYAVNRACFKWRNA